MNFLRIQGRRPPACGGTATCADWSGLSANGLMREIDHASFEWSPDGNFLISTQDATVKDTLVSGATEWIGWDPATSQVRSWSFVADGSIGENTWSNASDQWIVKTNAILPNGKKLTATNIITRNGPDAITWQSKDRTIDGKALPDVNEIKIKRVLK